MAYLISANRLTDGRVVFRRADGSWTLSACEAALHDSRKAADSALEAARADVAANLVLDLEPVEAVRRGEAIEAAHLRDRIRIAGPSVLAQKTHAAWRPVDISEQSDVSI